MQHRFPETALQHRLRDQHSYRFAKPKSGAAGGGSTGLVSSTTSGTGGILRIEIDKNATRSKRLRKGVITGARLHEQEAAASGFRGRWAMLTLTYRDDVDSRARDVSELLRHVRGYFGRVAKRKYGPAAPVFRYVWVLELTQRLRPHYHLLFWLPRGVKLPKPDQAGWWKQGSTRIEWARHAVGYMAKYASKFCAMAAAAMPKGFRTHAVGGLNKESQRELRWWKSPLDAREVFGAAADIRKTVGGYFDKLTGEFWPSPWRVLIQPDGRLIAWRFAT